ncbi:NAD-dependent protein deacetylase sirtuin-2 isoform X2 [Octopus bimaculoides]|uniref:NAD-dependent protein deacetylase n=1 Tax=Octopus bimaculoides TaxID=37653 RepID=A0A0L8IAL6_OCTBM|nr:NAD-dependent protein deacetylase sirtuin-2 isoform X2 [Octopus bimaculoides]|eukprot:XP_014781166.1 PREDICTED: NAD-dependent protein deacetylase sirtuin-2-like isoform X1 [Octopus bimaculoides]
MSGESTSDNKDEANAEKSTGNVDGPHPGSTSFWLRNLFENLSLSTTEQVLSEPSIEGVAQYIKSDKCKNIITMAGAGLSTSAGIPDFRSPVSGLYDNLEKYNLPHPQAIFEINFFRECPEPFFKLVKNMWPSDLKPTPSHYFLKLLDEKGLLLRHFTQNIDGLERMAGIDSEKIVEGHGTFQTSHCINCKAEYDLEWIKEIIFKDEIPHCTECKGLVKPDIVFFGEHLPQKFFAVQKDFKNCDLLIILGTSLTVMPFAALVSMVPNSTPRLYINLTKDNESIFNEYSNSQDENNYRDVFWQGTCDDGCEKLAELLDYQKELKEIITKEWKILDESKTTAKHEATD